MKLKWSLFAQKGKNTIFFSKESREQLTSFFYECELRGSGQCKSKIKVHPSDKIVSNKNEHTHPTFIIKIKVTKANCLHLLYHISLKLLPPYWSKIVFRFLK